VKDLRIYVHKDLASVIGSTEEYERPIAGQWTLDATIGRDLGYGMDYLLQLQAECRSDIILMHDRALLKYPHSFTDGLNLCIICHVLFH
jgi:hypothetical protein